MKDKNGTYCSIIDADCLGAKRRFCNECPSYKKAVKEAHNKAIDRIYKKYGLKKDPIQLTLPK